MKRQLFSNITKLLTLTGFIFMAACSTTPDKNASPQRKSSHEIIYDKAKTAYQSRDYKIASALFNNLAAKGHANAQYFLGYMYYYGTGQEKDLNQAVHWFNLSAAQGNSNATIALATIQKMISNSKPTQNNTQPATVDLRQQQPVTTQPGPAVRQPSPVTAQPGPAVRQPSPVTVQPGPAVRQPSPVTTQPGPILRQSNSVTTRPKPAIRQSNPIVTQSDPVTAESDSVTTESDSEIAESDSETTESDSEIAESDSETTEPDSEIAESDSETTEPDSEIVESDSETTESDSEIVESDSETTESDSEIAESDPVTAESDSVTAEPDTKTAESNPVTTQPTPVIKKPGPILRKLRPVAKKPRSGNDVTKSVFKRSHQEIKDSQWILKQPSSYYTIQLASSTSRQKTLRLIRQVELDGVYFFRTTVSEVDRYTIVHGSFPKYEMAKQKIKLLKKRGYKNVWVRGIRGIKAAIRRQQSK